MQNQKAAKKFDKKILSGCMQNQKAAKKFDKKTRPK